MTAARLSRFVHRHHGPLTEARVRTLIREIGGDVRQVVVRYDAAAELLETMPDKHYLAYTVGTQVPLASLRIDEKAPIPIVPDDRVPRGEVWLEIR